VDRFLALLDKLKNSDNLSDTERQQLHKIISYALQPLVMAIAMVQDMNPMDHVCQIRSKDFCCLCVPEMGVVVFDRSTQRMVFAADYTGPVRLFKMDDWVFRLVEKYQAVLPHVPSFWQGGFDAYLDRLFEASGACVDDVPTPLSNYISIG
jgi:hypothetical protein